MRNYTNNDLFSWIAIFEESSMVFFGKDPKNSQNLEIFSIWLKYNGIIL